ncbi:MAG: zinc-ribbon domain-containing protein [Nitrososphaerales archaeon]
MGLLDFLKDLFSNREYGTPSTTLQGEHVKSRAEQRIADYFTENGIRYVYEKGAQTDALIFKQTFAHPDFYLSDYNVYVEYWGLVDASKEYQRNMKWKMVQYHKNKIKFVSIYPDNMENINWIFRAKFRKTMGFDLPKTSERGRNTVRYCSSCGTPITPITRFCTKCGRAIQ